MVKTLVRVFRVRWKVSGSFKRASLKQGRLSGFYAECKAADY